MEDPQDCPRGEIIKKQLVLLQFCSGVSVSLETSSTKCLRKGLQKRNVMNDDADDDDDNDGDGDGDDDDVMVLVMMMVTMMRITMMVKATGRRRKLEEYGGVRKIIRTVL